MRRALGLGDQPTTRVLFSKSDRSTDRHQRRRFANDGEVPVVVLNRRETIPAQGNRPDSAEAALRSEQEARRRSERTLAESQATIHDLQTRLGHAVLERDEARDGGRQLYQRPKFPTLGDSQGRADVRIDALHIRFAETGYGGADFDCSD